MKYRSNGILSHASLQRNCEVEDRRMTEDVDIQFSASRESLSTLIHTFRATVRIVAEDLEFLGLTWIFRMIGCTCHKSEFYNDFNIKR